MKYRSVDRSVSGDSAISIDRFIEANRLAILAEAVAGFGHWRAEDGREELAWSPQMFAITGLPISGAPTRAAMRALIHRDDADRLDLAIETTRTSGIMENVRVRMIRPDGRNIHVALAGRSDGPAAILGTLRDVTAETEAEQALIISRDQARAAKAEVLAAISYEVRPPMAGMISSIDMLREAPAKDDHHRLLDGLSQSACTVMGVVDDMLDTLRGDSGRLELKNVNFDLKALVRTTIQLFQASAASRSISFAVHGIDGAPQPVRGDSARVQQLLSNLLSNAIKATDAGEISITLTRSRSADDVDFWMLMVKDSGRCMEGGAIGRIFSHADGIDALRNGLHGGAGLELAISQQIAEAMGGSIAASSDPARGTIFSVELPFARTESIAAEIDEEAFRPMRILLAEDNPINRRLVAALLTRQGHEVIAVEDGRRALSAITHEHFDLVVMDMQMPELDGVAATRAIRALDPPPSETPILAISADAQPERQRVYFEAGVNTFLPKPIVSAQLLDAIAKMRRPRAEPSETIGNRFNRDRLNLLVGQRGYEDAAMFMKMLLFDVTDRPTRIAAAVRVEAWDVAAIEADALRTLLDSFGSFSLARLLTAVARRCRRGECPPAIIAELEEQARELSAFLRVEIGGEH